MAISISDTGLIIQPRKVFFGEKPVNCISVQQPGHSGAGFDKNLITKLENANLTQINEDMFLSIAAEGDLTRALGSLQVQFGDDLQISGTHTIQHDSSNPYMAVISSINDGSTNHPVSIIKRSTVDGNSYLARIDYIETSKGLPSLKAFAESELEEANLNDNSVIFPLNNKNLTAIMDHPSVKAAIRVKKEKSINVAVTIDPVINSIGISEDKKNIILSPFNNESFTEAQKFLIAEKIKPATIAYNKDGGAGIESGKIQLRPIKPNRSENDQIVELKATLSEELNTPPMILANYTTAQSGAKMFRLYHNEKMASIVNQVLAKSNRSSLEKGPSCFSPSYILDATEAYYVKEAFSKQLTSPVDFSNPESYESASNTYTSSKSFRELAYDDWSRDILFDNAIDALSNGGDGAADICLDAAFDLCEEWGIDWQNTNKSKMNSRGRIKNQDLAFSGSRDTSLEVLIGHGPDGFPSMTIHDFGSSKSGRKNLTKELSKNLLSHFNNNVYDISQGKIVETNNSKQEKALKEAERIRAFEAKTLAKEENEKAVYNTEITSFQKDLQTANLPLDSFKGVVRKNIPLLTQAFANNEVLGSINLYVGEKLTQVNSASVMAPALFVPIENLANATIGNKRGSLTSGQRHLVNGKKMNLTGTNINGHLPNAFIVNKAGFDPKLPTIVNESPLDSAAYYLIDPERDQKNYVAAMSVNKIEDVVAYITQNCNPDVTIRADFDYGKVSGNAGVSKAIELSEKYGIKYSYIDSSVLTPFTQSVRKDFTDYTATFNGISDGNSLLRFFTRTNLFTTFPGERVMNRNEHGETIDERHQDASTILKICDDAIKNNTKLQLTHDQASILISSLANKAYEENTQGPINSKVEMYQRLIPFLPKAVVITDKVEIDGKAIDEKIYVNESGVAKIISNDNAGKSVNLTSAVVTKNHTQRVNESLEQYFNRAVNDILPELMESNGNSAAAMLTRTVSGLRKQILESKQNPYEARELEYLTSNSKGDFQKNLLDTTEFNKAIRTAIDYQTKAAFVEKDKKSEAVKIENITDVDQASISLNRIKAEGSYYLYPNKTETNDDPKPILVTANEDGQLSIRNGKVIQIISEDDFVRNFSDSLMSLPHSNITALEEWNQRDNIKRLNSGELKSYRDAQKRQEQDIEIGRVLAIGERPKFWFSVNQTTGLASGCNPCKRGVKVKDTNYNAPQFTAEKYNGAAGGVRVNDSLYNQGMAMRAMYDTYKSSNPELAEGFKKGLEEIRIKLLENSQNTNRTIRDGASVSLIPKQGFIRYVDNNGTLQTSNNASIKALKQAIFDAGEYYKYALKELNNGTTKPQILEVLNPKRSQVPVPGIPRSDITIEQEETVRSRHGDTPDSQLLMFNYPTKSRDLHEMILHKYVSSSEFMAFQYLDPINLVHNPKLVNVAAKTDIKNLIDYLVNKNVDFEVVNTVDRSSELVRYKDPAARLEALEAKITPIAVTMAKSDFEKVIPSLIKANKFNASEYEARMDSRLGNNHWMHTAEDFGETPKQFFDNMRALNIDPPTKEHLIAINNFDNSPQRQKTLEAVEEFAEEISEQQPKTPDANNDYARVRG